MGTIVSAVAPNMYVYAVARFLCGVGFAGKIITTSTMAKCALTY
jgi:predicted MFS family arabinose efflux permease